jgi:hypothetical protein
MKAVVRQSASERPVRRDGRRPAPHELQSMIDASPRQVAQREQWAQMFGPARLEPSATSRQSAAATDAGAPADGQRGAAGRDQAEPAVCRWQVQNQALL